MKTGLDSNTSTNVFKELDVVIHPHLGEGVVIEIINGQSGNPFMLSVEWDDDPPENYSMGDNPCFVYSSEVELV